MESYVLKINGRKEGKIKQDRTIYTPSGPVLSISNSTQQRSVNFFHAAWDKGSTRLAAGDCQGHIYLFHFPRNQFWIVRRLGFTSTYLTFSPDRNQDILVALSNFTIVSLDSENKMVRNEFQHHKSSVSHISFDGSGDRVLSCSLDQAVLWDLKTFEISHVLALRKSVEMVKVFFPLGSDVIISAFKDDSVFVWNSEDFSCIGKFTCTKDDYPLNMRAIDVSMDGKTIACAGKTSWFFIWTSDDQKQNYAVNLPRDDTFIKDLHFLHDSAKPTTHSILALLNNVGGIHIYDMKSLAYLQELAIPDAKIISFSTSISDFRISSTTSSGRLEIFDLENLVRKVKHAPTHAYLYSRKTAERLKRKPKKPSPPKKTESGLETGKLKEILHKFKEYPQNNRFFVWSHLLQLPHNKASFAVFYHQSQKVQAYDKKYAFINPGRRKIFIRIMSMLVTWCPLIQEVDYMQCMVFPFIKVLHQKTITCFEILMTLINNWCKSWFVFSPFPPFDALYGVENVLYYNDKDLLLHFARHDISPKVYAWTLLKTSFSEVFSKEEWFKIWDHAFSNPLPYLLCLVAAYNIAIRDVIFRCKSLEEFRICYRRHCVPALTIIDIAYGLFDSTPEHAYPGSIMGPFVAIPKNVYPNFLQLPVFDLNLQTLTKQKAISKEIDYIRERERELRNKENCLHELEKLHLLKRDLLMQNVNLENIEALDRLDKKMRKIQTLVEEEVSNRIWFWKKRNELMMQNISQNNA